MVLAVSDIAAVMATPERNNQPPTEGASIWPTELNAWARFKRLEARACEPSSVTKGFAATCSMVTPAASTKMAERNTP